MNRLALVLALALLPGLVRAAPLEVWITSPQSSQFVYGQVIVAAEVASDEPVERLEFLVDGKSVGFQFEPPFRTMAEVGDENREHEFKVVVRTRSGRTASAVVVTPALVVDEVVEFELQQLYVTATLQGERVVDLTRDDFRVLDEGREQSLVTFERGDIPLTAALLLDCSLSMKGERLAAALAGAEAFVRGMKPLDEAMVVLFSDRLLRATEFSSDQDELAGALAEVTAAGGTAINDHLFLALKRLDEQQGRRVVVLFSDGADVHSVLSMQEVLEKARASQALIYWIQLREPVDRDDDIPSYTSSWRDMHENRKEFRWLREAVEESGGREQLVFGVSELGGAFKEILAELREQYALGYYPSDHRDDGRWRRVRVKVDRSGVRVRTREGYFDY